MHQEVTTGVGLTPWEDFNNQTGIWSVIYDDFTVVRDIADKTFIKRIGSLNYHSGIIYKRENLLWLFSTGTIYSGRSYGGDNGYQGCSGWEQIGYAPLCSGGFPESDGSVFYSHALAQG